MASTTSATVKYGDRAIDFQIIRRSRKTLEISVQPDGKVIVVSPLDSSLELIMAKVKKRAPWILTQKKFFDQFNPRTPERQYIGGESHLYLGRKYRLKIEAGNSDEIKLRGGFFHITLKEKRHENVSSHTKSILDQWYLIQAQPVFNEVYQSVLLKWKIPKPTILKIRVMKTRWGSLSKRGTITLNPSLIKAPRECIEYVITHELCHTVHDDHSAKFYKLLAQKMPDWKRRKQRLEDSLI